MRTEHKYVEIYTNNKQSGDWIIVKVNDEYVVSTHELTLEHIKDIIDACGTNLVQSVVIHLTDKEIEDA